MAAPHVSGAAALLMARHNELVGVRPSASSRSSARPPPISAGNATSRERGCSTSLRALQSV